MNQAVWSQALQLDREFKKRGKKISRVKLGEALSLTENIARFTHQALEYKEIIRVGYDSVPTENKKTLVMVDLHIPYHDKIAVEAVLSYAEKEKIDRIVILGDLIDFFKISDFVKIRGHIKKSVYQELSETKAFLTNLRTRFNYAEIIYLTGNHESRMQRYIYKNAAEIAELIEDLIPNKLGVKDLKIDYKTKYFKIGHLWFLHGHEVPKGGGAVANVCNKVWKYVHDHFICGHFHQVDVKTYPHVSQVRKYLGNSIGWLGNNEAAEYAPLNRYVQGFAIVGFDGDNFRIENKKVVEGIIF